MARGKPLREEDKKAIVELIREEIHAYEEKRTDGLSRISKIGELTGYCGNTIRKCMSELTEEEREFRNQVIDSQNRKKMSEIQKDIRGKNTLSDEDLASLCRDYVYFPDTVREIAENYGVNPGHLSGEIKKGISRGFITSEEYYEAWRRKIAESRKGRPLSKETKNKISKIMEGTKRGTPSTEYLEKRSKISKELNTGKILAESAKRMTCTLNGEIFGSPSEAAAAHILQRYIPGYSIKKGETFQVDSESEPRGIFDFVIPSGEIVEWHPPNVKYDASDEDRIAYLELMKSLSPKEKHDLKSWFNDELSLDYWLKRQDIADASQNFSGRNVLLVRNVHDLYNEVLSRYSDELPSFEEVEREYESLRNSVELVKSKAA